jgi:agmatinase
MGPRYQPPDASGAPRYTGIRTFARCPHVPGDLEGVDVAVLGVPFDTATSMRPGARFGPAAIRDASLLLRPWHPVQRIDVFGSLSVVDRGDVAVTPGNAQRTAAQIAAQLAPVLRAGVVPLVLGGDHSIVLGELRAHAAAHGPLALVLLDAHADTWDEYYGERYFHGTPFRRAVEEGLVDPHRSLLAGMRGSLYAAADLDEPRGWGFEIVPGEELRTWPPATYAQRVRARVGDHPAYLSFDIDVVDPAFAPATGTPEVCGLLPHEAIGFLRALRGVRFTGYDVVEVAPAYDTAAQTTALLAANIAYELITLTALQRDRPAGRRSPRPAAQSEAAGRARARGR